ncbi:formyl transferase [Halomonas dongshanensis]|uniref:phosphoribosylglycinamide formyltransferase 1 n=1 Tax=Halomonas dongshanensis TaxID=2890835 RepID=A0ABT2EGI0_9GAMM|nr:formyl transferase [Halomonas dongshanensis]MCS2610675.1 formyl transferase [Halomonas dongshanensis]
MPRVTLLCSDGPHHLYLAVELKKAFGELRVIVEPGRAQVLRLRMVGNYRGYLWARYHDIRRCVQGYSKYRQRYFARGDAIQDWKFFRALEGVKYLETPWINDSCVISTLREEVSDIYIVMGTKIINSKVLDEIPSTRIINVHGGHLPEYKGNHCFFFALNNGDYEKLSTTIHRVSSSLDAGEIISHHSVKFEYGDNSETLYSRAEKQAIDSLVTRLRLNPDISNWENSPQPDKGCVYRMRDRGPLVELRHHLSVRRNNSGITTSHDQKGKRTR